MRARRTMALVVATAAVLFALTGCSSDGSDGADDGGSSGTTAATDDTSGGGDTGGGESTPSGSASGTLTLDGEEIELSGGLCYLEEQPAAAGGGSIEATAQASGTDADGDEVMIDFTRFSADNQFAGDDVSLTIGDPFSPDARSLSGTSDAGTVSIDGSTVSASDFEVSEDLADTVFISFTIEC